MEKISDQSNQNTAMAKFVAFCELHKSDEELANSFESFLVDENKLDDDAKEENLKSYKALEELVPVLYELASELKQS